MLTPKICREHASKCTQTAEKLPPGAQRQMFLDMAVSWLSLAAKIESSEALLASSPANDPNEPYRFGSRIDAQLERSNFQAEFSRLEVGGDPGPHSAAGPREAR